MPAALLWAYSAENDFKLSDTGQPAGCPVSHFHQRGRKGKRHLQRLFPAETAALWMGCPLDVTSPFVKKQFRNARRRFGTANKNNNSTDYGQSARGGHFNRQGCRRSPAFVALYRKGSTSSSSLISSIIPSAKYQPLPYSASLPSAHRIYEPSGKARKCRFLLSARAMSSTFCPSST